MHVTEALLCVLFHHKRTHSFPHCLATCTLKPLNMVMTAHGRANLTIYQRAAAHVAMARSYAQFRTPPQQYVLVSTCKRNNTVLPDAVRCRRLIANLQVRTAHGKAGVTIYWRAGARVLQVSARSYAHSALHLTLLLLPAKCKGSMRHLMLYHSHFDLHPLVVHHQVPTAHGKADVVSIVLAIQVTQCVS